MAAIAKPPPVAMAVLAIAAFWYLTQRRAVGATMGGQSATPTYGTQGALNNGTVKSFGVSPSGVSVNPISAALGAIGSLFGSTRVAVPAAQAQGIEQLAAAYGQGGPSAGYYASATNPAFRALGEIVRPVDYVPSYTPDSQGEQAAQGYFMSNMDEFISNPPPMVAYASGEVGSTGGWLDQQ